MSKLRALLLLTALCTVVVVACGDSSNDGDSLNGEGPPPPSLVGVWTYQSVTVDGVPSNLADVLDWVPGAVRAEIEILASSAFVYQEVDANGAQLWFETGFVFVNDAGEVDVNIQRDSEGEVDAMLSFVFTVSGDSLTLQEVGGTLELTLVRNEPTT